jgi:hypothetical protein
MNSEDYVSLQLSQVNPITSNMVVSHGKVGVGGLSLFSRTNSAECVCRMQNGIQVNIDRSIEVNHDGVPSTILIGNGKS